MGYEKFLTETTRRVEIRVQNKTLGKHELLINGRFKG
jgi:hypothetical protein